MQPIEDRLRKLKERRVFRVAAAYAVVGAGVIGVADPVFQALELPALAFRLLVVVTLLGFPLAVALAWAAEPRSGVVASSATLVPPARRRAARRWNRVRVVGAVAVIGLAGVAFWMLRGSGGTDAIVTNRVVVLPPERAAGDAALDELGDMAMEWITNGLSTSVRGLDIVPASHVRVVAAGFATGGDPVARTAARTQAGILVFPSIHRLGGFVRVGAEILDAGGRLLYALDPATSPAENPMPAADTVRDRVAAALAQHLDRELLPMWSNLPAPSLEAYRQVRQGMEYFAREEFEPALEYFAHAIGRDSAYAAPVVLSAWAHHNLGRVAASDSFIRLARAMPDRLSAVDRASLDMMTAMHSGTRAELYRAARLAWEIDPTTAWYLPALAARAVNRPGEALEYLVPFDPEVEWHRDEAYEWALARTAALHMLGRYEEEIRTVHRAYALDPDRADQLRDREMRALAALGQLDSVAVLRDLTRNAPRLRARYPFDAGTSLRLLGLELRAHGHEADAIAALEAALEYFDSERGRTEWEDDESGRQLGIARALLYLNRDAEALPVFEALLADSPTNLTLLGWVAVTAARLGDEARYAPALERIAASQASAALLWEARVAAILGERERAMLRLRASLERSGYGTGLHYDPILSVLLKGWEPFDRLLVPAG